jgi:hypothetical protein
MNEIILLVNNGRMTLSERGYDGYLCARWDNTAAQWQKKNNGDDEDDETNPDSTAHGDATILPCVDRREAKMCVHVIIFQGRRG